MSSATGQVEHGRASIADIARKKHIVLETYRKNGEGVRTPVWFVEENGTLYVRTGSNSRKVKRLRRNPKLRLAESDVRGTVKGPWLDSTARVASGEEREKTLARLKEKYGLAYKMVGLLHKFTKPDYTVLAIRIDRLAEKE